MGEKVETVADFMLGSKITGDSNYSHEIKKHLLLGRKNMTNLDSMLKSRDITIADKAAYNQSYGFSSFHIWMWELAECQRMDAFELWCGRRLLKSALDSKEIKPVNPKKKKSTMNIHWKDWCWSWRSNILATCYKEPTHWEEPWCWERLKTKGEGDDRGWNGWIALLIQWTWIWLNSRR